MQWMGGWTERRMDGWTDGRTDGGANGLTDELTDVVSSVTIPAFPRFQRANTGVEQVDIDISTTVIKSLC